MMDAIYIHSRDSDSAGKDTPNPQTVDTGLTLGRLCGARILQETVVTAINHLLGNRENVLAALQENIETVIRGSEENSVENIEAKLEGLQRELLQRANSKKDYDSVADEIYRLRELKQNALVENAECEGLKKRMKEMREFLDGQDTEVVGYDEVLVRKLIEKVTVYEERFEVEFKSGAKVDVEK